jgi:hypothetical protein
MQWLQDQVQCNVHNLNNVVCKASRHLRNKKREYLRSNEVKMTIEKPERHISPDIDKIPTYD